MDGWDGGVTYGKEDGGINRARTKAKPPASEGGRYEFSKSLKADQFSRPVARILVSSVLGAMPNFSAARVLFQRHSRNAFSSSTRST
jgi:hypothetical protein